MIYEVKSVVCDYGVFELGKLRLVLNSRDNALLIKAILDKDSTPNGTQTGNYFFTDEDYASFKEQNKKPSDVESSDQHKTNFDICCESAESMAQIVDIMKAGWTKEEVLHFLQSPAECCNAESFGTEKHPAQESAIKKLHFSEKSGIPVEIDKFMDELKNEGKFDINQMNEIRKGLESKVKVSVYADPTFDWEQMREIREGLESKVDVKIYVNDIFDSLQMREIRKGLESKVDVRIYANTIFDSLQMHEIRKGLESKVDVSVYRNPTINWEKMYRMREDLESELEHRKLKSFGAKRHPVWSILQKSNYTEDGQKSIEQQYDFLLSYVKAQGATEIRRFLRDLDEHFAETMLILEDIVDHEQG